MKFSMLFASLFVSLFSIGQSALAGNAPVGSWNRVNGVVTKASGEARSYIAKVTILDYQTVENQWLQKYSLETTWLDTSVVDTIERYQDTEDVATFDFVGLAVWVGTCADRGGVRENYTTQNGNIYDTCKFSMTYPDGNSVTRWIAAVPGADVKAVWQFTDGTKYEYELIDSAWQ
jgi:hypothetical protein